MCAYKESAKLTSCNDIEKTFTSVCVNILTLLCIFLDVRHFLSHFRHSAGAFFRKMRSSYILAHLKYSLRTSKCILGPRLIFSCLLFYEMIFSFWVFDFNKMRFFRSFWIFSWFSFNVSLYIFQNVDWPHSPEEGTSWVPKIREKNGGHREERTARWEYQNHIYIYIYSVLANNREETIVIFSEYHPTPK